MSDTSLILGSLWTPCFFFFFKEEDEEEKYFLTL